MFGLRARGVGFEDEARSSLLGAVPVVVAFPYETPGVLKKAPVSEWHPDPSQKSPGSRDFPIVFPPQAVESANSAGGGSRSGLEVMHSWKASLGAGIGVWVSGIVAFALDA